MQNVRQSTTRWRLGNRLATASRAKAPIGTTFSFSLNEEATVTGHASTNKVAFQSFTIVR